MAKKNIKTLGRKALSLLLTLTMVTSMLQLPAMAASYDDQTMDGYYIINENGNQGKDQTGATSVTEDGYTLTKTIEQTGKDAFDITLTVETSQTVTTSASKAATVLVIDLSNSMKNNKVSGSNNSRMKAARDVAKDFLKSYAGTDENASQYLSIVWFGTYGGVDIDWVNVAGGAGKNSYDAVYSHLDTLSAPHNGDKGGTNLDRGLEFAESQMEARSSIVEQKNVVIITDGVPTRRMDNGNLAGNGQNGSEANNAAAAAEAADIKADGATVYTVCLAAEDDVCYTGSTIYVCEHCNETQDHHTKVTLCRNCGEAKSEHTHHSGWGYSYYTCSGETAPYGYNDYYSEQTSLYCADGQHTYKEKAISGDVTVGYFLSNDIASSASTAFNAKTTADLEAALKAIASRIESTGVTGEGTAVADPMGQYIVLGDVSALAAEGVTASGNSISWALDPANAETRTEGNTTYYTYSITYPITLDTSVEGFQEGVYYPANGHTWLGVPQADGSVKKISFLVPGVCGTIPEYEWTVEYYLQTEESINEDAPAYELDNTDNMGEADLHSSVNAPEGYESKYERQNYTFAEGETVLKITADPENNVIRLYYDLITAAVTEKHYYKTTTITPAGETIVGEYVEDPDKTSTSLAVIDSEYEAIEQPIFGGVSYDFDEAKPADKSVTVRENGENLVELFYSRTDDQRVETSAQVDHVYTLYTYELNEDGKYELTAHDPVKEEKVQYSEDLRATTVYNVSDAPKSGYEGYELNEDLGDYKSLLQADGSLSFVLKDAPADNIRTLYFEKVVDTREEIEVTVEHYYTKNITAIEDGAVINYNDPDNVLGLSESFDAYVGERFTAVEENDYQNETYISDNGNAGKLHIDALTGNVTIQLYYDKSVAPEKASVIANHYWRTYTDVTVELTEEYVNEETGETETRVIGTDIETRETIDHKVEGIEYTDLYVGQKHIEAQRSWGEGYTFNAEDSTVEVIAGSGREADLYYDKYAEDDERSDADITVHHIYTTYLTTIVDGKVDTLTIVEGPEVESYEGLKAGDEFAAIAQPVYNENEYTQITAEEDLSVILQPGTNATIIINYEREASDLVDADYSVDYEYRTYTMTVNENGEAGYWNAPEVAADAVSGEGYVGQKVVLDTKAIEGFTALPTNPGTVQVLSDGENHWTFVYEKCIPLAEGSVVVNHHYKTITIAVNGTSSEATQSVYGNPVVNYIGESYTAEAVSNGFVQTGVTVDSAAVELAEAVIVTVGENTVIDFYYEKSEDFSIPVEYSIAHEYYLYDWDGSLISESKPAPVSGTGFATTPLVVAPEATDYELTSATYNGVEMDSYTIILQEGENKVLFVYEKTLPRDFVNATVIHNYYKDEAAMLAEIPAPEQQYTAVTSNLPESSSFSAQIRDLEGYEFHSAAPESMEIIVTEDGENLIVLNYIRSEAEYEVIHVYYGNGEYEGRTSESFGGLHGETVTAESIAREPEYNGNAYNFVSISEDIVLDTNEKKTIELVYERSYMVLVETGYSIAHEYFLYDWNGTLISESKPEPTTGRGNVGESLTASPEAGEYTLVKATYNGADLADYTITLQDGKNEIVFTYEKTLAREKAAYEVIHIYNRNGSEEGRTSQIIEGLHGEEIDSESIAHVTVYNGRSYNFRSVSEDIVLDSDEMKTIVLEYNRKTGGSKPVNPTPTPDPVEPTPTPDPIEIPDEDVPLAPAPADGDVEIPDEEVPLAVVPKTGDESFKFILMALASALGLAGLTFTGKKREEEME